MNFNFPLYWTHTGFAGLALILSPLIALLFVWALVSKILKLKFSSGIICSLVGFTAGFIAAKMVFSMFVFGLIQPYFGNNLQPAPNPEQTKAPQLSTTAEMTNDEGSETSELDENNSGIQNRSILDNFQEPTLPTSVSENSENNEENHNHENLQPHSGLVEGYQENSQGSVIIQ